MGRHTVARDTLPPRPRKLLAWIRAEHLRLGYQPSTVEMAEAMGVSPSSIMAWLAEAERLGYIERGNGAARAIKFLREVRK